jgi:hypothetical protein
VVSAKEILIGMLTIAVATAGCIETAPPEQTPVQTTTVTPATKTFTAPEVMTGEEIDAIMESELNVTDNRPEHRI